MLRANVCIVGAGLSGLSTAYHLARLGVEDITILEANTRPGGLLLSKKLKSYTFDIGGSHIIFSHERKLLSEMLRLLGGNYVKLRRNTKIFYKKRWVKYPFEIGLRDLPPKEKYECLRDLILNYIKKVKGEIQKPKNFSEWLEYVFGSSIARKYLIPYNEKIWKTDLRKISLDWVNGRVPNPPIEDILKSIAGLKVEGYKHQANFYYPAEGGIETLARSLFERVRKSSRILLNTKVEFITPFQKGLSVHWRNGSIQCKTVVFTAPLNRSSDILKDLLGSESKELKHLRSVPLAVVGIGIKEKKLPYHWMYFPDKNVVFHRLAVISNYSPRNAPSKASTLIAEVSFPPDTNINTVKKEPLVKNVIEDLLKLELIKNERLIEVSGAWLWRDAYIIYDEQRRHILKRVKPLLMNKGVILHGRFGEWEYLNMDAVYKRSKELASEIARRIRNLS